MTGVVLAGGLGTRLRPLTYITNKHLLPVYDRPMIDYPLATLRDMGCNEIIIVAGGEHIGGFAEYLGSGYTYRVQDEAGGVAQALGCVKGLVDGLFPVILGDNYLSKPPKMPKAPTIWVKSVDQPNRFGVYIDGQIIEKPTEILGNKAVIGLYVYDQRVFGMIKQLKPSKRGELEITDINNAYLKKQAQVQGYNGHWSDMGTFESLQATTRYILEQA